MSSINGGNDMLPKFEIAVNHYAKDGWKLFWTTSDKKPVGPWKDIATDNWALLRATYRPGYCLAGTPPRGVFVLDVDGDAGKETLARLEAELEPLPQTRAHRTQSGGLHLLFRHQEADRFQFQGRHDMPGLDGRAPGRGYVLLPPSEGRKGRYEVIEDLPIATLPQEWAERLMKPKKHRMKAGHEAGVPKILVDAWAPGQRDALFLGFAGFLRKEMLPLDEAKNVLDAIMRAAGDEERAERLAKLERTWAQPITAITGYHQVVKTLGEELAEEVLSALRSMYSKPWDGCLAKRNEKTGTVKHYTGYAAAKRLYQYGGLDDFGYSVEPATGAICWYVWAQKTGWTRCQSDREIRHHLLRRLDEAYAPGLSPTTHGVREFQAAVESSVATRMGLIQYVPDNTGKRIRFRNGTYHIDTMQLMQHSKDDGYIPVVDCDFDDTATCPETLRFLQHLGPNESYTELFLAIIGQILFGSNPSQRIFHLMGEGGAGKSTFANLCRLLLPKALVAEGRLERINDTHETSAFVGKRLITFSDPDKYISNVEVLKKLTGEDTLLANPKYEAPFPFRFTGNVLITSNHAVAPRNHCTGWDRRYMLIPCNNVVPDHQRDPDYLNRVLAPELPGLVNEVLRRFRTAKDAGKALSNPSAIAPSYARDVGLIKEETDPLAAWVGETLIPVVDPNAAVVIGARNTSAPAGLEGVSNTASGEAFPLYYEWCKARGYQPLNQMNFTKGLSKVLKEKGWVGNRVRKRVNGERQYVLTHVKLVTEHDDNPTGDGPGGSEMAAGTKSAIQTNTGKGVQDPGRKSVSERNGGRHPFSVALEDDPGERKGDHHPVPARPEKAGHRRPAENTARRDRIERRYPGRLADQGAESDDGGLRSKHHPWAGLFNDNRVVGGPGDRENTTRVHGSDTRPVTQAGRAVQEPGGSG